MGPIRKNVMLWAIGSALTAFGAAAAAPADGLTKAELKAWTEFVAAAEAGDCELVLKRAKPLADRSKRTWPNALTVPLYEGMAECYTAAKRVEEAYSLALRGTALAESSPRLWYIRIQAERETKRYAAAASTLEAMTEGHGAALNDFSLSWMFDLLGEMKEAGAAEARTRTLRLLASDVFAPSETFGSNDEFRFSYATDRLEAGDVAAAGPVVARLEAPDHIAAASLDPRMRGFLANPDVAAAATRMLARNREWMAREPDRLRPIIAAATNLRQLGRSKEALDLLKSAEPRLAKLTATEDSDYINWWWNELATTCETLNRPDEAVAAYRKGATTSEDGGPNVSQLINLALAQNRLGRPKDALATIAVRDLSTAAASPFGMMLYRRARACALHLDSRGGEAAADVDYIKSHEKDAPETVTELYLCLGDMEAAAASAIRRLDDPELRAAALLELSDYDLAPPPLPTDRTALNLEALKKRADVKAAIARAGGTRHFNVAA